MTSNLRVAGIVARLLVAGALSACAPDQSPQANQPLQWDSAGVTVHVYQGAPRTMRVDAEPVFRSDDQVMDEALKSLHQVSTVLALDSSHVLVADGVPARLIKYNIRDGTASLVAQAGSGPGEFRAITWAVLGPDGGVRLYDNRLKRLTEFDQDLQVQRVLAPGRVSEGVGALPDIVGAFADGGFLASSPLFAARRDGESLVRQPLRLFSMASDGSVGDSLVTIPGDEALVLDGVVARPGFLRKTRVVVGRNEFHVTDGVAFEVRTHSAAGQLKRIVRGASTPPTVPDSLVERYRSTPSVSLPEPMLYPATSGLLVDDRDLVWLAHSVQGSEEAPRWTVLDADGVPEADVELPANFVLLSVWRGLLFGVARDPLGEEAVVVYRLDAR